ncbi:lysis system o-spanin lipoprotein Rz1 [Geopseudomonas aromaticivorans]|uniref:lysis system o-spanin lipoprotein Rz1 n=1 Tax=Geopseudomonas aromaticivorans TaxID=2849492 RepID=UPI0020C89DE7|nr:lysis system o-spanin lipoprotein Rz1 [Pseudomonas aromaticivorans]
MLKRTLIALLLTSLLLASGCASESIRPVAVECPTPPAPPAWMMEPEPKQTYTLQLQQVLSE